ncbi:MAG: hypothetical protein LQ349_009173 [Xanthoria aureola]|nr:MAG: hypothetical protein LQ349_009173 [Xanthoria aureola]
MYINQGNIFSSKNLRAGMLHSLPRDTSPQVRDTYDAVALLANACMIAVGFRLQGLGEDHIIETTSDSKDPPPLPKEWNASATSNYAFRYAHSQSSLQFILKISRLGNKAIVNGLAIDDDKVHTVEVPIRDFISQSSLPFTADSTESTEQNESKLANIFISPGRIADLCAMIKLQIIQKLAPGLQKEGYEESAHAASTADTSEPSSRQQQPPPPERGDPRSGHDPLRDDRLPPPARPRPFNDPLAAEPRRPYPAGDFPPPGFEDEYEMNRPPGRGGLGGERRPLNIGERDLYPPGLGPHDPLRGPGFGPSGGIGGGGMHPTFDDPMFGGDGGGGMGGYDGRAPPGARYDPVGPGDGPPNIRGGPRFPGGGVGGRPPNPFGGFGGNDFI